MRFGPRGFATAPSAERATSREVAAAPEREPAGTNNARPDPARHVQTPDDLIEMQQVAAAEKLLQRSPERALALVRQGDQRFGTPELRRHPLRITGHVRDRFPHARRSILQGFVQNDGDAWQYALDAVR